MEATAKAATKLKTAPKRTATEANASDSPQVGCSHGAAAESSKKPRPTIDRDARHPDQPYDESWEDEPEFRCDGARVALATLKKQDSGTRTPGSAEGTIR